jgi:hypothetical protein
MFVAVFMVAQNAQVFSGRRIGGRLTRILNKRIRSIIRRYSEIMKREGIELVLIQDRASSHAADTGEDLREREITVIFWLPFPPDLKPIKRVWHTIKNYLQNHYLELISYDVLRRAVKDSLEKVGDLSFGH